jgi:hypothetical protein
LTNNVVYAIIKYSKKTTKEDEEMKKEKGVVDIAEVEAKIVFSVRQQGSNFRGKEEYILVRGINLKGTVLDEKVIMRGGDYAETKKEFDVLIKNNT